MPCTVAQVRAVLVENPLGFCLEELALNLQVSKEEVYIRLQGMRVAGHVRWSTGHRRTRSPSRRIILTERGRIDRRRSNNSRQHRNIWNAIPAGESLLATEIASRIQITKSGVRKQLARMIVSGMIVRSGLIENHYLYGRGIRPSIVSDGRSPDATSLMKYLERHPLSTTTVLLRAGFGMTVLRNARKQGKIVAARVGLRLQWSLATSVPQEPREATTLAGKMLALLVSIGPSEVSVPVDLSTKASTRVMEPLVERGFLELRGRMVCGYGLSQVTPGQVDPLVALRSFLAAGRSSIEDLATSRPRLFRRLEHAGQLDGAIAEGLLSPT